MTKDLTPEEKAQAVEVAALFSGWTANPQTKQPGHLYICAGESLLDKYTLTPKENL